METVIDILNSLITSLSLGALLVAASIMWSKGPAAIAALIRPASLQVKEQNNIAFNTKDIFHNNDKKANPIVRLQTLDNRFFCTGFVISDLYMITAAHCLVDFTGRMRSEKIRVMSSDQMFAVEGTPIAIENVSDLALVKGDFNGFNKIKVLTNANDLFPLSAKYKTCGFPLGVYEITCYPTQITKNNLFKLQGTGILIRGQSGGPVIDLEKNMVVALNTAVDENGILLSPIVGIFSMFAVPVQ